MQGSTATLILNGDASTFTGGVLIPSGMFTLNSTILSGITNSAASILNGTGTANGNLDISGAFVPGRSNVAGTFHGGWRFDVRIQLRAGLKSDRNHRRWAAPTH